MARLTHQIPENARNSELMMLIDEFVRLERDRQILKDHWFGGRTFEQIAGENHLSINATKNIIYGIGDKILLKL